MKIGNVNIDGWAALAPMAGVTDRAFRELCVDFGASYVVGEMVSAKGLVYNSEKSRELMVLSDKERPAAVQLFGNEPAFMAEAARIAMEYHPDIAALLSKLLLAKSRKIHSVYEHPSIRWFFQVVY